MAKNEMHWSHIGYPDETGRSKVIAGLGALSVINEWVTRLNRVSGL